MNVVEWSDAPYERLAPLYEAERQRWMRELQWDPAPAFREVEQARTTWGLPGLLAVDDAGRVRGSAFYVVEDDRLDIGGITSDHVDATDALIDRMLAGAHENRVRAVRTMLYDGAVALRSGLARRGFEIGPHLYLSRSIGPGGPAASNPVPGLASDAPLEAGGWREEDLGPAAALLRRAYDAKAGSLFAPHGHLDEWQRYVENLTRYAACGTLNPGASLVMHDGAEVRALVLVTDISPRTAHIVQLAVDPACRGRRLGTALVAETVARLEAMGYRAVTLLVAEGNQAARALYDAAGFRHDACFLAASHVLR